jgi:lipoic acid synthetase
MINRLPHWFRQDIPEESVRQKLNLLASFKVNTVCKEAKCPNLSRCFKAAQLTFMLLGDVCTRNCLFCNVRKAKNEVLDIDWDEPYRIAELVKALSLNYVVITSVTRDDLADGGAGIFAKTITLIRALNKNIAIEVLIPDFSGNSESLKTLIAALPTVVAHNLETVPRLYKELRPQANYRLSLAVLRKIKTLNPDLITKSSLMLGMGEQEGEVIEVMKDLRQSECDILTLGQYLAPSPKHYPVKEFMSLEKFTQYRNIGLSLGFKAVLSGPLVRSSYQAEEAYKEALCMI